MKIALFSDIHANLPAFEAFMADVKTKNVDAIYCLGDLIGYNCWPNEIVSAIREQKIPTLAGNHDFNISRMEKNNSFVVTEGLSNGAISKGYTNALLTDSNRLYLQNLPAHIRLEFQQKEEKINVLLVHGSPNSIDEYLLEEKSSDEMLSIMNEAQADILCFGHTHKPFHKIVESKVSDLISYKHAINIGSVGKPKDRNSQGCYVIIELNSKSNLSIKESIKVDFIRFDYAIEKAAQAVENSILPNDFAMNLRNGF